MTMNSELYKNAVEKGMDPRFIPIDEEEKERGHTVIEAIQECINPDAAMKALLGMQRDEPEKFSVGLFRVLVDGEPAIALALHDKEDSGIMPISLVIDDNLAARVQVVGPEGKATRLLKEDG